jgi:hypothetical protein
VPAASSRRCAQAEARGQGRRGTRRPDDRRRPARRWRRTCWCWPRRSPPRADQRPTRRKRPHNHNGPPIGRRLSGGGMRMDIHEYQAKDILARFGVPVPRGGLAWSPEQAAFRARELGAGPMGGQGADPRGRPGRGGGREALPHRGGGAPLRSRPVRQEPRDPADRGRGQAGGPAVGGGGLAHRPRDVSGLRARPQIRAHHDRRLRRGRHRDRGTGRHQARQPAPHGDRPGRGARHLPGARDGLRPGAEGQAGRADGDGAARLLPRLSAISTR